MKAHIQCDCDSGISEVERGSPGRISNTKERLENRWKNSSTSSSEVKGRTQYEVFVALPSLAAKEGE